MDVFLSGVITGVAFCCFNTIVRFILKPWREKSDEPEPDNGLRPGEYRIDPKVYGGLGGNTIAGLNRRARKPKGRHAIQPVPSDEIFGAKGEPYPMLRFPEASTNAPSTSPKGPNTK
jgi:hypothetical protein